MPPETTEEPVPAEGREAPPLAIPLRAGPLRLVFDRGELRWIRLGEREVLRGIYAAVREAGWATVPARIEDLVVEAEPDSFRIRFVARHARGDVRFDWAARLEGSAEGRISYAIDGVAGSSFLRNRIGFCVLHPASECAGAPCTLETVDGTRRAVSFPRLVSPQQPFLELRAIAHEPAAGVVAEVRLEGDTFETEDQRNWSDCSFKTYCHAARAAVPGRGEAGHARPPVGDPEPERQHAGARPRRRRARARRRRRRSATARSRSWSGRTAARSPPVPRSAWPAASRPSWTTATSRGFARFGSTTCGRTCTWAIRAGRRRSRARPRTRRSSALPLELALVLPDEPRPALLALARRASQLAPRVGRWLLFRAADHTTHDGDAALAREILAGVDAHAGFGGGCDRYFAELNRRRPSPAGLDVIAFSLNPQVHAFDDATLFENVATLPWLAETARSFAPGLPLAITPVTLRPRSDPRPPASRAPGEPPFTDDPRQSTPIAAAWTLALLGQAARAGFASLTFFEPTGPRGLMDAGQPFAVFHALRDVAAVAGAGVLALDSRRPERVQAIGLRSGRLTRLFLANIGDEPHPVRVEGLAGAARRAPLGAAEPGEECGLELDLEPRAVARLDVTATEPIPGPPARNGRRATRRAQPPARGRTRRGRAVPAGGPPP